MHIKKNLNFLGDLLFKNFDATDSRNPIFGLTTRIKEDSDVHLLLLSALNKGCIEDSVKHVVLTRGDLPNGWEMLRARSAGQELYNELLMGQDGRESVFLESFICNTIESSIKLKFRLNWKDICQYGHAIMESNHLEKQVQVLDDEITSLNF